MTPLEILALIFCIIVLIKITILFTRPKSWMKVAETMLKNPHQTLIIYFILIIFTGYFLLKELNIVQITAVLLFASFLIGLGILPYSKQLLKISKKELKDTNTIIKNYWLQLILWLVIVFLTLFTLLK